MVVTKTARAFFKPVPPFLTVNTIPKWNCFMK
jgi:hypothetical protein